MGRGEQPAKGGRAGAVKSSGGRALSNTKPVSSPVVKSASPLKNVRWGGKKRFDEQSDAESEVSSKSHGDGEESDDDEQGDEPAGDVDYGLWERMKKTREHKEKQARKARREEEAALARKEEKALSSKSAVVHDDNSETQMATTLPAIGDGHVVTQKNTSANATNSTSRPSSHSSKVGKSALTPRTLNQRQIQQAVDDNSAIVAEDLKELRDRLRRLAGNARTEIMRSSSAEGTRVVKKKKVRPRSSEIQYRPSMMTGSDIGSADTLDSLFVGLPPPTVGMRAPVGEVDPFDLGDAQEAVICDHCEEDYAVMRCVDCELMYCEECGEGVHRKGTLATHTFGAISEDIPIPSTQAATISRGETPEEYISPRMSAISGARGVSQTGSLGSEGFYPADSEQTSMATGGGHGGQSQSRMIHHKRQMYDSTHSFDDSNSNGTLSPHVQGAGHDGINSRKSIQNPLSTSDKLMYVSGGARKGLTAADLRGVDDDDDDEYTDNGNGNGESYGVEGVPGEADGGDGHGMGQLQPIRISTGTKDHFPMPAVDSESDDGILRSTNTGDRLNTALSFSDASVPSRPITNEHKVASVADILSAGKIPGAAERSSRKWKAKAAKSADKDEDYNPDALRTSFNFGFGDTTDPEQVAKEKAEQEAKEAAEKEAATKKAAGLFKKAATAVTDDSDLGANLASMLEAQSDLQFEAKKKTEESNEPGAMASAAVRKANRKLRNENKRLTESIEARNAENDELRRQSLVTNVVTKLQRAARRAEVTVPETKRRLILRVSVIEGKHLHDDIELGDGLLPFVIVSIDGKLQRTQTTAAETCTPQWGEDVVLDLTNVARVMDRKVEAIVYRKSAIEEWARHEIGRCSFSLSEFWHWMGSREGVKQWFTLKNENDKENNCGRLHLHFVAYFMRNDMYEAEEALLKPWLVAEAQKRVEKPVILRPGDPGYVNAEVDEFAMMAMARQMADAQKKKKKKKRRELLDSDEDNSDIDQSSHGSNSDASNDSDDFNPSKSQSKKGKGKGKLGGLFASKLMSKVRKKKAPPPKKKYDSDDSDNGSGSGSGSQRSSDAGSGEDDGPITMDMSGGGDGGKKKKAAAGKDRGPPPSKGLLAVVKAGKKFSGIMSGSLSKLKSMKKKPLPDGDDKGGDGNDDEDGLLNDAEGDTDMKAFLENEAEAGVGAKSPMGVDIPSHGPGGGDSMTPLSPGGLKSPLSPGSAKGRWGALKSQASSGALRSSGSPGSVSSPNGARVVANKKMASVSSRKNTHSPAATDSTKKMRVKLNPKKANKAATAAGEAQQWSVAPATLSTHPAAMWKKEDFDNDEAASVTSPKPGSADSQNDNPRNSTPETPGKTPGSAAAKKRPNKTPQTPTTIME